MTKIYATLLDSPNGPPIRPRQVGDLVLVELPQNCSVDGEPGEMRAAILFLLNRPDPEVISLDDLERYEEIERRYR